MIAPEEVERFWAKVRKSDKPSACWEWTAGRDGVGYGRFKVRGEVHRAHRVMWLILHGELPEKPMIVRHRCDNPPCVNPDHLQVGTYHDNNQDCEDRGRMSRGVRHTGARLTDKQVREARKLRLAGATYTWLAAEYGVNHGTIQQACTGTRWRHVSGPLAPIGRARQRRY